MSPDEAVRHIESSDRERESWTRFLYGVDWLDPALYDMTFNLRTLSIDGAVEAAVAAVGRPEFAPTEASRRAMENLVLESRIRAALAADDETAAADVQVHADGGRVALRGRVRPARMVEAILEVVGRVEGVAETDSQDLCAPEYTV
jgi:cytidylate kinase